jgi:hypothetical protein
MKKRTRGRKNRVQWHPKKSHRQVCLQNFMAMGYSKTRALLICEGFEESGHPAIPEKYPSPFVRGPGKPAGTIHRGKTMSIVDQIADFFTSKRHAHAHKVKRMMKKHRGMSLGEASKAVAGVSDFMDGARARARKRMKRTVKVCYCEKKYLARDGSRRTRRYRCACNGAKHRPKKWMQKVSKRTQRGALHRTLGIPLRERIPYKLKDAGCKDPVRTLKRVTGRKPTKSQARKFQKRACLARTYEERGGRKR